MSSLKTEQYQLHQWEPGDSVLREEFNENFAKLDVSTRLFFGSYTGDGAATRTISLPITPKAVFICERSGRIGYIQNVQYVYGGLFLPELPLIKDKKTAAEIVEGGFRVYYNSSEHICANSSGAVYHYLVLW